MDRAGKVSNGKKERLLFSLTRLGGILISCKSDSISQELKLEF